MTRPAPTTCRFRLRIASFREISLVLLLALVAAANLVRAQDAGTGGKDGEKEKSPPPSSAEDPGSVTVEVEESKPEAVEIPELPPDQLPPRTRTAPDPRKDQYLRKKVYVEIAETIEPEAGGEVIPEHPVVDEYLEEYFRRAGFEVVPAARDASYRITGAVRVVFDQTLVFRGQTIGWKYYGGGKVSVAGVDGVELEEIPVPDTSRAGAKDEATTARDLLRFIAKSLHDRLFLRGTVFGEKEIAGLLDGLLVDPLEADDPLTVEAIIEGIADFGLRAVPLALEALTDTRSVLAASRWPGLDDPARLRVYHVADKVLEEIFQKVSRMSLDSSPDERYVIIRGWENEWRRFCPPFRESPVYKRWLAVLEARREAAAKAAEESAEESAETKKVRDGVEKTKVEER